MASFPGTVAIVVPCFNEARRLDVRMFQEFAAARPELRFVFVNDGSTDKTLQIIEGLRENTPESFEILHLPSNCGKAEAVRKGMLAALMTSADYVGFWDADLATPLDRIDALCGVLHRRPDIEIVFGSRMSLLGHRIRRTLLRRHLGRVFAFFASCLLGFRIHDTQCGAKVFRSSSLVRWMVQHPFSSRWIFDVEMLSRLRFAERHFGFPPPREILYEFPLDRWDEIAGGHLKSRDFYKAIADMTAIYWRWLRPGALGYGLADSGPILSGTEAFMIVQKQAAEPRRFRAA